MPLLAAGKPVLLEQPLALSTEACNTILAAAKATGTMLGVNDGFMHHPAYRAPAALLQRQELGRPVMVFCIRNLPFSEVAGQRATIFC